MMSKPEFMIHGDVDTTPFNICLLKLESERYRDELYIVGQWCPTF